MKLIRKKSEAADEKKSQTQPETQVSYPPEFYDTGVSAWKILVVDDEPDVHAITKLSLKNFRFADRKVEFLNAMSGAEAMDILRANPDIAAALIDVVMETEDAGLRLVKFIREELNNHAIRLIIRTGQPGSAPERYVIDHFDIDDYKEKTELIADKLYTTLRSAIKAYRDLSIIQRNRHGLEKILNSAPQLHRLQPMEEFLEGVLIQVIGLCHLGEHNLISANGFIALIEDGDKFSIRAGTGRFIKHVSPEELEKIRRALHYSESSLPPVSILIPLKIREYIRGFIYLEDASLTSEEERHLIDIMVQQCTIAFENLDLYQQLEISNKINERKNRFLGMAAHDLRNPIGGMKTIFELLRMSLGDRLSAEDAELMDMGKVLADTSINLVSDLLDIAKIESGKLDLELRPTDLMVVVMQSLAAVRFISESKHIPILYEPAEMPDMMLDPKRMQQVVVNLLSNAIKYSHPHTKVKISVSESDKEVVLTVKDAGQGIPADDIGKLFQPFVKANVKSTGGEQSTGLGLVICKKITEAHGGRIWVESQISVGTTFFVAIPKENK